MQNLVRSILDEVLTLRRPLSTNSLCIRRGALSATVRQSFPSAHMPTRPYKCWNDRIEVYKNDYGFAAINAAVKNNFLSFDLLRAFWPHRL